MLRVFKWGTVSFIVLSTFGYISWVWFNFHSPYHWIKLWIGLGYGLAWGAAIIHWLHDLHKWKSWIANEKEMKRLKAELDWLVNHPPPYRCPDCGIVSHNPHDFHNQYCGFCQEFKGDRFR